MGRYTFFLSRFLKNPRTVGAIAPSSAALARAMIRGLDLTPASRIVELGPGTGSFTREIVGAVGASPNFLAVEVDPLLAATITDRWPGVACVCDSAEHLRDIARARGLLPVDHIVSGLPFASLPAATSRRIMDAIAATLRPGGTFTTFQYWQGYALPPAVKFRRETTARLGPMRIEATIVWNLPPAWVLRWTMR